MTKNYRKQIRESLSSRRHAMLPGMVPLLSTVVIFTAFYCVLAVYAVPSDKPPEFNFQDESGAVTALSALFMALACGFAIASNAIHLRSRGSHQWLWVIFAAGLAFLAFDEVSQIHERFGRIVTKSVIPLEIFRNWNDAIVISYGVVALPLALLLLPRLLRYRIVPEAFAAAFLFYAIHTLIDSTQEPPTLTSIILEESAKLFSAAFLAIGTFAGLIGNIWKYAEMGSEGKSRARPAEKDVYVTAFEAEVRKIHLAK